MNLVRGAGGLGAQGQGEGACCMQAAPTRVMEQGSMGGAHSPPPTHPPARRLSPAERTAVLHITRLHVCSGRHSPPPTHTHQPTRTLERRPPRRMPASPAGWRRSSSAAPPTQRLRRQPLRSWQLCANRLTGCSWCWRGRGQGAALAWRERGCFLCVPGGGGGGGSGAWAVRGEGGTVQVQLRMRHAAERPKPGCCFSSPAPLPARRPGFASTAPDALPQPLHTHAPMPDTADAGQAAGMGTASSRCLPPPPAAPMRPWTSVQHASRPCALQPRAPPAVAAAVGARWT